MVVSPPEQDGGVDRLDALLTEVEAEVGSDLGCLLDDTACDRLVRVTRLHDLTAVLLSRTIGEVEQRKATTPCTGRALPRGCRQR